MFLEVNGCTYTLTWICESSSVDVMDVIDSDSSCGGDLS